MKTQPVEGLQPQLLIWARTSMGLSVEEVAVKMGRETNEVEDWESGATAPSYPQLEKLAYNIFKRPLAMFFFPEPPEETTPLQEFRSLPESDLQELHSDTYLKIRRGHAYQLALKEVFEDVNPAINKIWEEVRLKIDGNITEQAVKIRNALGISMDVQLSLASDELSLKHWRSSIEEKGIFIFKESFKQKDISGFCLWDDNFPLIYLNNSTTKTRQLFSLLHELSHILLHTMSLSKFEQSYINRLPLDQKKIEVFCNAIAAETLIPLSDFNLATKNFPMDVEKVPDHLISEVASRYNVSREAILRRFLEQNRVSQNHYNKKADLWAKQQKGGKGGKGGNWYATTNTYLSTTFAREVVSQQYNQKLSVERASELLGISAKNFSGLEQVILRDSIA